MLDIKLEKQLPVVQMNFDEVKASLIEGSKKYKNLVVTEESLKDCKTMQKELSKTKNSLDTYRKGIKKEMLIPVTKFEGQCKELIGLVEEMETPIKDGIAVFDDKAREVKRQIAIEHINKVTIDLPLNEKYSNQLTVLKEYTNASMSVKKLKEDIDKRGYLLQQEQQQEAENLQIIKDTIENCNKSIDAKLDIQDFQSLIDTEAPISKVLAAINDRSDRIKANELKAIADNKAKAEKVVLDRIAKAEHEAAEKARIEERNTRIAKQAIEDKKLEELKKAKELNNVEYETKLKLEHEAKARELSRNIDISTKPIREVEFDKQIADKKVIIPASKAVAQLYFIEMRAEGNLDEIKALSHFLKENNYKYEASSKGKIKK